MHLQDWGIVGAQPAKPSADTTPGYPTNGSPPGTAPTVLDARYLSVVIRELYAAVDQFGTPDRADDEQLAGILAERISALFCDATDTGSITTDHLRAVIASTTSQASGAESMVGASDDMVASGINSVALASDGNGSPQSVAALRSLVAASLSCGTTGSGGREAVVLGSELSSTSATARAALVAGALYALITGTRGAVIASEGTSGVSVGVTGTNSATIASLRTDGTTDAGGSQSLVAASEDSSISGGTEGAIVASEDGAITGGAHCAIIASDDTEQRSTGTNTALIGTQGCYASANGNAALIGSANAEVYNRTNGFGGGYSGTGISFSGADQNLTIWFNCQAGTGVSTAGFSTGSADFAEYVETAERLPFARLVALALHDGIMLGRLAEPGDDVIGITSERPGFLGNDDDLAPAGAVRRKDDPDRWVPVAFVGQLPLEVDGTVVAGAYIEAGAAGVGTASSSRTPIRCLRLLEPGLAQVLIR